MARPGGGLRRQNSIIDAELRTDSAYEGSSTAMDEMREEIVAKPKVHSKVVQHLVDALARRGARVMDLFREWDTDGSGIITAAEFERALTALGLDAPKGAVIALFDEFDADGDGHREVDRTRIRDAGGISFQELNRLLRRARASASPTRAPHVGFSSEGAAAAAIQARIRGKSSRRLVAEKKGKKKVGAKRQPVPKKGGGGGTPKGSPRGTPRGKKGGGGATPKGTPRKGVFAADRTPRGTPRGTPRSRSASPTKSPARPRTAPPLEEEGRCAT